MDKTVAYGRTPLLCAAADGYLEVTYLLEQGADRDKADNCGSAALHLAAICGHLVTAMLRMSCGADLNARNDRARLPIHFARNGDEPRRRMDHGHKRATEQDRHPNAATSVSAQQEDEEKEEGEEQINKRPRFHGGAVAADKEIKVTGEVEDSEPSDNVEDNN